MTMNQYFQTQDPDQIRIVYADHEAIVPRGHRIWIEEIQPWLDAGNIPTPFELPTPTLDDIRAGMKAPAWAIRRALTQLGLRAAVEAAIAQADQDQKDMWNYATEFKRTHPIVNSLAASLGKTPEEIDALFSLANSLEE